MDQYVVDLQMGILFFDLAELEGLINEHGSESLKEYLPEIQRHLEEIES